MTGRFMIIDFLMKKRAEAPYTHKVPFKSNFDIEKMTEDLGI
jgi:hypothetical protein